jgi:nucleotide-binding universal stress UspA family protein
VLLGLGATGLVYATKYAAATVTQRIYKYSQDEKLTMWGLSQAQAAATLATILVGQEVGLFPDIVFDAAIMAVFFTSISSPWLVQRFGSRLKVSTQVEEGDSVFDRILIPIANPKTQDHLTTLAAILARTTEGTIMPLHVVRDSGNNREKLQEQDQLLETAVSNQSDVAVEPLRRIDSSVAKGILHASAEHQATMIAMGWRGEAGIVRSLFRQNFFGDVLDEVVWNAEVPVLVARMNTPINSLERLILVVPANSLWLASISRISEIALSISDALNLPLLILADKEYMATFREDLAKNGDGDMVEVAGLSTNVAQDIQHEARENDLVLISSTGSRGRFQSSLGRLPEEIAKQSEVSLMVLHYPERALRLAISKTEAPDFDETE